MHALDTASQLSPRRRRKVRALSDAVEESDEAVLTRIAVGDRVAFARLFEKYAPKVKSYLMRLGAPAAVAEDLAQDAMATVWRRAATYNPTIAKASTWMFVIARKV